MEASNMNSGGSVREIGPADLKKRLDGGEQIALLDVREPHELAICKLSFTSHIPLGLLPQRLSELNELKGKEVVVYCRSGGRSQRAAQFLAAQGFKSVYNLAGGILAWSEQVDPSLPTY
jgi:adenylyltransferase/sulfurtransferase